MTLRSEDMNFIAGLINDKNNDLKELLLQNHETIKSQIKMIKITVQENHNLSQELKDFYQKISNEIYGEIDPHGNVLKGKEGLKIQLNNLELNNNCNCNLKKIDKFVTWKWGVALVLITASISSFITRNISDPAPWIIGILKTIKFF